MTELAGPDVVFEDLDVGLLDRVVRFRGWTHTDDNDYVTTRQQSRQQTLPEELMAALEEHIGDGLAKVTVGGELGHSKEYGCKAQSFVSISVHCNLDEATIETVKDLVQEKVRIYTNEDLAEMIVDRDGWMERDKAGATGGKLARQPAAKAEKPKGTVKPKPKSAATKPKASGSGGKVRKRPSMRR